MEMLSKHCSGKVAVSKYLVVSKTDEDDVRLVDPDFLPELASDVAESLDAVEAHCFQPAVAKHLDDLCVLLAVFLEDELTFEAFVFVLSAPAVLASLSFILGHFATFLVSLHANQHVGKLTETCKYCSLKLIVFVAGRE